MNLKDYFFEAATHYTDIKTNADEALMDGISDLQKAQKLYSDSIRKSDDKGFNREIQPKVNELKKIINSLKELTELDY